MPIMRGGPLKNDEFQFINVQFRWSSYNSRGAEHSIDNVWYSMEAQVMHWNMRYGSIDKCYDKPDGIAILSYLMQVVGCPGISDNPALAPITDKLSEIKYMNSTVNIKPEQCGQSPIDLIDKIVRPMRFPPLIINGHWLKDGNATLFNDGVTARVSLSGDRIPSTISGGPLMNDEYEFYDAHFHWGEENCRGAEHTINGTWFSMECHMVHWNRKYLTSDECLKRRDGFCVLAYLFLVQPGSCQWNNIKFERISENLKYIQSAGSETKIPPNSLSWMRIATDCLHYYTYHGSYNLDNNRSDNPECAQWIVFPTIIPLQLCQINEFRKLKDKNGEFIKSNRRDIQLLRGRKIFLQLHESINNYERNKENVQLIQELASIEGKLESPIDLNIGYMRVIELNPLQWCNYNVMPKKLKLTNTGYTVILSAKWETERPCLRDGPFASSYTFSQIHFHWGETNMDGSEHRVDGESMPMELHAVHFKSDYETQEAALRRDDGVTILVYLFQLQANANPLLDNILRTLPFVQAAHSSVRLTPFLVTNIMRCFQRDYFVYWGSVKMISYRNSVLWVISRKPVGISMEQVAQFRTLYDERKMPLLKNCRPLQNRSNRNVFHVCPSGTTHATLLPIPRHYSDTCIQGHVADNDKNIT
ncbi:PREDICTED: uncharacterized protein LOC106741545 [Dinoponera quadriceps]|uniref:Uncharacterized protein LOC106741545 n=1 Tax=Dinoponera quadriceps TaxID=609295 RepID=A0A6P3WSX3_DINQU|nr:PREDICTED: uncharacterized protein LOC106741545 [Dinoponera quadriceps]